MKNKAAAFLAVLLLCLLSVSASVFADSETPASSGSGYTAVIEDGAELFSESERSLLLHQLEELLSYGNMGIVTNSEWNSDAAQLARDKYLEIFGQSDGTILLIDMYNRRIQIFSGQALYRTLTQAKANEITDNIYTYASDGDYYTAASKAFEQIRIVLEGGRIVTPMRYATNAAFAVGLVLLVNFIILTVQRRRNAPGKELTNALVYDVRNRSTSVVQGVRSVMTKQSRRKHVQSSGGGGGFSGGGGGFTGGGGGGGFSGGGGGHSF